jgi:uncharacterized membrane protein YedE/YeeE
MKHNACALAAGMAFGFVIAWARLTDPFVIRQMLLLQEFDVFLLMGSAIAVAAAGSRILRAVGARAWVSREPVQWTPVRPQVNHLAGSALFGVGWSLIGTCPGPVAAMIGEGKLSGLVIGSGILLGVLVHRISTRPSPVVPCGQEAPVGL